MKKGKTGAKPWSTLVGKFFHTFTTEDPREGRGEVQYQGVVLSDLGSGYFVVQLFSFVTGDPTDRCIVHIETMAASGWSFYETDAEMRERYEHYHAHALREAKAEHLQKSDVISVGRLGDPLRRTARELAEARTEALPIFNQPPTQPSPGFRKMVTARYLEKKRGGSAAPEPFSAEKQRAIAKLLRERKRPEGEGKKD